MASLKEFATVEFPSDNSVDVVPTKWLVEGLKLCPFPANKPKGFQRIQEDPDSIPDPLWPTWEIIFHKSYSAFEDANKKAIRLTKKKYDESSEAEFHSAAPNECNIETNGQLSIEDQGNNCPETIPTGYADKEITEDGSSYNVEDCSSVPEPLEIDQTRNLIQLINPQSENEPVAIEIRDERVTQLIEEFRAFQRISLKNQIILQTEIRTLKSIVLRSLANTNVHCPPSKNDAILWPVVNEETFNVVCGLLATNEIFEHQENMLSRIGGNSVSKTVNNILKFVLDHNFALQLRLTDSSGKLAFGGTICCKLVKGAVRRFYGISSSDFRSPADEKVKLETSEDKLDSLIGKWLRDSTNRKKEGKTTLKRNGGAKDNQVAPSENPIGGNVEPNPEVGS